MSHFKRSLQHQHVARQDVTILPPGPGTTTNPGGPGGPGGGGQSTISTPTTKPPPAKPTTKPPPKNTEEPTKKPPGGDQQTTESDTSTSSTATQEPESKSSSSSRSTARTVNTLNTPLFTSTPLTPTWTPTTETGAPTVSSTSESSNSTTGSLNTGTIIGGIAGGIGGIALIAVIISFIMRRIRSKRRADEYEASQFRGEAMVSETPDPRPFSLFGGRFTGVAPSIRSSVGPGMAGHGAYHGDYSDNTHAQPDMQYDDYQSPTSAAALQPRQQYTYGEAYDNAAARDDDLTHGAYSEQPQAQGVYNLEAYGDYEAYTSNNAIQYPSVAHQGRHAKHNDDPYGGI